MLYLLQLTLLFSLSSVSNQDSGDFLKNFGLNLIKDQVEKTVNEKIDQISNECTHLKNVRECVDDLKKKIKLNNNGCLPILLKLQRKKFDTEDDCNYVENRVVDDIGKCVSKEDVPEICFNLRGIDKVQPPSEIVGDEANIDVDLSE
ncbi:MAG: hypothetical protein MHPSP_004292 [Paramarteilia canceri]